jgi:hypothetical protein
VHPEEVNERGWRASISSIDIAVPRREIVERAFTDRSTAESSRYGRTEWTASSAAMS